MNKYDIIVTDTLGLEHRYYIETNKNNDINKAWERNTGIQINYIEKDKECVCIYDNKKVLSVDVKDRRVDKKDEYDTSTYNI